LLPAPRINAPRIFINCLTPHLLTKILETLKINSTLYSLIIRRPQTQSTTMTTMKRVFSFPKVTGLSAAAGASKERVSSTPITDFIGSTRKESRKNNRGSSKNKTSCQPRSSHNDLARLGLASNIGDSKKKMSSHNDLSRVKSKGSNSSLGSLFLGGGAALLTPKRNTQQSSLQDKEVDEIYKMVKKLNSSNQGQKLLNEFVDYQTGKTTRIPKVLAQIAPSAEFDDPSSLEFAPPVSEIYVDASMRD
jgi:hypothetical protein